MKDYIFTIFLVLCIIIVIVGVVGIFAYFEEDFSLNISNEKNSTNQVSNLENINSSKNKTTPKEDAKEDVEENAVEKQKENIEESDKKYQQKNINVEKENDLEASMSDEPILNQIVNKFNTASTTREMVLMGYPMRATAKEKQIAITTGTDGLTIQQEFYLNDNILLTTIGNYTEESDITAIKILLATSLFDCVAQLKGHQPNKLTNVLMADEVPNYTIEKDGVQIIDGDMITMKIDVNSELLFLNN